MSNHTACAVFTFKDKESKTKFINFCNGPKGLDVTRNHKGCQSIECYEKHDNELSIVIWQKWDSKEDHEAYVKFRHEDGSFDFLGELVASPPDICALSPLSFKSDEDQIRDIVNDMCDVDYKVGIRHMHDDCVFIRPSGNPLDKNGWEQMMNNEDVTVESSRLVSLNKLSVCGCCAYVCYTQHGKFTYKGTANDDVAVFTSVLKKENGVWKVVQGTRSTGRKPEDKLPAFA